MTGENGLEGPERYDRDEFRRIDHELAMASEEIEQAQLAVARSAALRAERRKKREAEKKIKR